MCVAHCCSTKKQCKNKSHDNNMFDPVTDLGAVVQNPGDRVTTEVTGVGELGVTLGVREVGVRGEELSEDHHPFLFLLHNCSDLLTSRLQATLHLIIGQSSGDQTMRDLRNPNSLPWPTGHLAYRLNMMEPMKQQLPNIWAAVFTQLHKGKQTLTSFLPWFRLVCVCLSKHTSEH